MATTATLTVALGGFTSSKTVTFNASEVMPAMNIVTAGGSSTIGKGTITEPKLFVVYGSSVSKVELAASATETPANPMMSFVDTEGIDSAAFAGAVSIINGDGIDKSIRVWMAE